MASPPDENEDFAALLAEYDAKNAAGPKKKAGKEGDLVRGRILSMGADTAFIDLGGKSDGMMDLAELRDADGNLTVKVGDEIEGRIVDAGGASGAVVLRRVLGRGAQGKAELEQAFAHQIPVEGVVTSVNKGGIDVQIAGVRAFCPISQLELRHVDDAQSYVGQKLQFRITRYEAGPKLNLVVSRRALLEEESAARAAALRGKLSAGAVLHGKISGIKDYGVFVDLGGIEGMLHVSQLSFQRVEHPKDLFTIGQELEVQVLKIEKSDDPKRPEKISLSLKSLERDPWSEVRFGEGARTKGRVVRVETFGAFIELSPGIEGLVHISELGQGKHLRHAKDVVRVGQELAVVVLNVDAAARRISLALPTPDSEDEAPSLPEGPAPTLGTFAELFSKAKQKKK